MRRFILFVAALAAIITVSVWLADNPGSVTLQWLGWRLDTGVPVLLLFFLLSVVVVLGGLRFLRGVFGIGRALTARLDRRRASSGHAALGRGFAALQAGDARTALKLADTAATRLKQDPAARLLTAEAARLAGNAAVAREQFEYLMGETGMELAALRGLSLLADAEGNAEAAVQWARRALDQEPGLDWARQRVVDGLSRSGQWDAAVRAVQAARRAGGLSEEDAHHRTAALLTGQAQAALDAGQPSVAVKALRKALNEHDPRHRPAGLLLIRALQADGAAKKAVEAAVSLWRTAPHADLAQAYMDLFAGEEALKQVAHAEKLAEANPEHPESRLLVARCALAAKLWGQARSRLKPLVDGATPNRRACLLMAEIEDSETGDVASALRWMRQAAAADR
ncbi:heme biosynthesis HemY N-terminal domain-containing protein [Novispirillum itersonii]|uniref:heme biosynthesis HemY N-terminal domain-containing protein n=1 Tax=Novispirillum itersonii TaxID=189 RepID=UPI00036A6750|nr:heme biosynthesis HemY N-terminal domain-containing protein [Novispirillum itersonii]